ncbi:hypothetical protein E7Y35_05785 [Spiroplasma sp. SV19]|nr:hypothetical protein E7Y35_05785 [Spiroplasma sp. SV19]
MQSQRTTKIINYFYLIKLFNGNRDYAAKFYIALDNFLKLFSSTSIEYSQLSIFDDTLTNRFSINELNLLDIWSNDFISIVQYLIKNKIKIKWNQNEYTNVIDIIKNNIKSKYNNIEVINNIMEFISDVKDEIDINKILYQSGNIVHYDDKLYPEYFKNNIDSPPICFFYEGNIDLLNQINKISIVGTRIPSEQGIKYTEK